MSSSSSQQNFRKAICAIKDSTSVGIAKVNSDYKDIKVSILKATNHINALPKEKHVRAILSSLSGSRPRADVAYCIHTLTKRLVRTHSWVVALKALIVIHRALREVDHSFCEELIYHNNHRGNLLSLLHFKDDSGPTAWDYSTWIRTYALYIEECLECFRVLKYDFYRDHSRTKKFGVSSLLDQLPSLQQLLYRLLCCQPAGAAQHNYMIQYALSIILAESVRLYVAITDGLLVLVDKFFDMARRDAVRALEIYRKAGEQAQRLSEFFEMCRSLEFGRRQKYVKIEQPPASFLKTMEEYIKEEAPQQLMLPWTDSDDTCVTSKVIANLDTDSKQASSEEGSNASDDSEDTEHKDVPPLIPDLLSWEDPIPIQEASESDAAATEEPSNVTPGSEFSSEPASWELALVTTTPDTSSVALTKGGVLDISVLDSLYNAAQTQTNTSGAYHQTPNASSNPFEADSYAYDQNMLYNGYNQTVPCDPSFFAHPMFMQQEQSMVVYDHTQIGGIPQQPFTEQYYDQQYMHISGIPQQQPPPGEQQHHQRESSFAGLDFTDSPQVEGPLQQHFPEQYYDQQNLQISGIPQQPALREQQHHQRETSFAGLDFIETPQIEGPLQQQFPEQYYDQQNLQISGIPQQPALREQQHHQRETSFAGLDFTETPQVEGPMQQQFPDQYYSQQNLQISGIPQPPPAPGEQQHHQRETSFAGLDFTETPQVEGPLQQQFPEQYYSQQNLQISGIPQQQPALGEQQHHQRETSFAGLDFTEMPQVEGPLQQQNESTTRIGNPFVEQSPLPVVPQNDDPFNFSLL